MTVQPHRRDALQTITSALGGIAFAAMATGQVLADETNPLAPRESHFPARAKRVIFLSMRGAPSHLDMFDYKPQLSKNSGRPSKYGGSKLLGSPWKFAQRGKSGLWVSSLLPEIAKVTDELCMLKGMHSDQPNHIDATLIAHTGTSQFIRPSLGAWSLYGLGTENQNVPGFVVLGDNASVQNYGSAFLPTSYQGTVVGEFDRRRRAGQSVNSDGVKEALPNIRNKILDVRNQRKQLDFIQKLNQQKLRRDKEQAQVEGIIRSYELAFTMQTSMPEMVDVSKETDKTKRLYGMDNPQTADFGLKCLLARRMAESGVRFVEVTSEGWDHHSNLKAEMEDHCEQIDKPIAGLIQDLKQRGLLADTLVVWAGEFGRTPHGQGGDGRDHNNRGYTTFMAGGGVKAGFNYGATDEYGYEAVAGKMHTHDWHATILHLLGLDHERLTYQYAGRDFRLTDVAGNVAKDILA